ncbi:MAG: hypothetical protein PHW18_12315 [Sulfuricurvum sp.]|uniref:hypothetical protein n=1 Tax=Sulfuricurvum sp. TaxID=2025608 RepID=UPI00260F0B0D|nr:hypothetical protein [Sulfuricurvum sp.]MDD2830350.1 hypothetical protein [Sulfuricurvum sp.]MDD4950687.1 hypothetical protein [Sulfuricurvum sp.]
MKKTIEKNELAALFFLHYFKYTRYAFKKQKSEEDIASIHAHRELMRLFGRLHNNQARVGGQSVIDMIVEQISPSNNPFVQRVSSVMEESIAFIYDHVLLDEREHPLLERYA